MTLDRQRTDENRASSRPPSLDADGFVLLPGLLGLEQCDEALGKVPEWERFPGCRQRHGATFAVRDILWSDPTLATWLEASGVTRAASETAGSALFPVDAMLFDKIPESNWKVPGHQDVVMPVAADVSEAGFSGWAHRNGTVYVQPPVSVLERLLAARIHLDEAPNANGPLAVLPGSHRRGRIRDADLAEFVPEDYRICEAARGDVLLVRPLLVHRSAPAAQPRHRRVLHVVYAAEQPGQRVRWRS